MDKALPNAVLSRTETVSPNRPRERTLNEDPIWRKSKMLTLLPKTARLKIENPLFRRPNARMETEEPKFILSKTLVPKAKRAPVLRTDNWLPNVTASKTLN
jgi:hypothetical protein